MVTLIRKSEIASKTAENYVKPGNYKKSMLDFCKQYFQTITAHRYPSVVMFKMFEIKLRIPTE